MMADTPPEGGALQASRANVLRDVSTVPRGSREVQPVSVIRTRRVSHFTTIPNEVIRDPNLGLPAKGLLTLMLSYPDDWAYNLKHLATVSASGTHATRSAFQELERAGYVTRSMTRSASGTITGYEYIVRDEPTTVVRLPDDGKADVGEADDGEPHTTKTDSTKTDHTNTDRSRPKNMSSALATTNGQKSPPATRPSPQAFIDIWNEHKGFLPACATLNAKRQRGIAALTKEHGRDALDLFTAAVQHVAADDWWIKNGYNIDNLLRPGRVLEKAEKWRSAPGMTASDRKTANIAATIARAIGMHV